MPWITVWVFCKSIQFFCPSCANSYAYLQSDSGSAPGILAGLTDDLNMGLADTSNHACTKIEASALGCLEYYGFSRGRDICKDHYDDFMECVFRKKQVRRLA